MFSVINVQQDLVGLLLFDLVVYPSGQLRTWLDSAHACGTATRVVSIPATNPTSFPRVN